MEGWLPLRDNIEWEQGPQNLENAESRVGLSSPLRLSFGYRECRTRNGTEVGGRTSSAGRNEHTSVGQGVQPQIGLDPGLLFQSGGTS